MRPLCQTQIPGLFDAETPPCMTLYIPLVSNHQSSAIADTIKQLIMLARHEIAIRYSPSQADKLSFNTDDIPLDVIAQKHKGDTLALFSSPDIEGYLMVKGYHPKAYRVGDSFFLKPLSDGVTNPLIRFGQLMYGRGHAPFWFPIAEPT